MGAAIAARPAYDTDGVSRSHNRGPRTTVQVSRSKASGPVAMAGTAAQRSPAAVGHMSRRVPLVY
jgi:hypothetical protein